MGGTHKGREGGKKSRKVEKDNQQLSGQSKRFKSTMVCSVVGISSPG